VSASVNLPLHHSPEVLFWHQLTRVVPEKKDRKTVVVVVVGTLRFNLKRSTFWDNKFGLLISRGSVATYLRCSGQCYMGFVANFVLFLTVKKILKMVKFWPSYSKLNHVCFFGTQCIYFAFHFSMRILSMLIWASIPDTFSCTSNLSIPAESLSHRLSTCFWFGTVVTAVHASVNLLYIRPT